MKNCSFLLPWFLLLKSFCLRSNINHSTPCFITRWKTSKFVKNTPLRVVFTTIFSVFYLVMKHCFSCLICSSQSREIFQTFLWWTISTSVNFRTVCGAELYLNLAILRILRRSFQWCWHGFSLTGPCQKLKKPWKGLLAGKWKGVSQIQKYIPCQS